MVPFYSGEIKQVREIGIYSEVESFLKRKGLGPENCGLCLYIAFNPMLIYTYFCCCKFVIIPI